MDYRISNRGPVNAKNGFSGIKPDPECFCWNCQDSSKVVFRVDTKNLKVKVAYCGKCDTQFNAEILKDEMVIS